MSNKVYIVTQYQPEEDMMGFPIYACTSYKKAQDYARRLNKEYGCGCVFNDDWDFEEYSDECEPHYYDVETLELDEPLAPFFGGKDEK